MEARQDGGCVRITARAVVAGFDRTWETTIPSGDVELAIVACPPPSDFSAGAVGGDRIRLLARPADGAMDDVLLTKPDGRHWAFETAKGFTGRAFGVFAADGEVLVRRLSYRGED